MNLIENDEAQQNLGKSVERANQISAGHMMVRRPTVLPARCTHSEGITSIDYRPAAWRHFMKWLRSRQVLIARRLNQIETAQAAAVPDQDRQPPFQPKHKPQLLTLSQRCRVPLLFVLI